MILNKNLPLGGDIKTKENLILHQNIEMNASNKIGFEEIERIKMFEFTEDSILQHSIYNKASSIHIALRGIGSYVVNGNYEITTMYPFTGITEENFFNFVTPNYVKENSGKCNHVVMNTKGMSTFGANAPAYDESYFVVSGSGTSRRVSGIYESHKGENRHVFTEHTAESMMLVGVKEQHDLVLDIELSVNDFQESISGHREDISSISLDGDKTKELYINKEMKYPYNTTTTNDAARFFVEASAKAFVFFYNDDKTVSKFELPSFGVFKIKVTKNNQVIFIKDGEEVVLGGINPHKSFGHSAIRFSFVASHGLLRYKNVAMVDGIPTPINAPTLFGEYVGYTLSYKVNDVNGLIDGEETKDCLVNEILSRQIGSFEWPKSVAMIPYVNKTPSVYHDKFEMDNSKIKYKYTPIEHNVTDINMFLTTPTYETLKNGGTINYKMGEFDAEVTGMDVGVKALSKYNQNFKVSGIKTGEMISYAMDDRYSYSIPLSPNVNRVNGILNIKPIVLNEDSITIEESYRLVYEPKSTDLLPEHAVDLSKFYAIKDTLGKYFRPRNIITSHIKLDATGEIIFSNNEKLLVSGNSVGSESVTPIKSSTFTRYSNGLLTEMALPLGIEIPIHFRRSNYTAAKSITTDFVMYKVPGKDIILLGEERTAENYLSRNIFPYETLTVSARGSYSIGTFLESTGTWNGQPVFHAREHEYTLSYNKTTNNPYINPSEKVLTFEVIKKDSVLNKSVLSNKNLVQYPTHAAVNFGFYGSVSYGPTNKTIGRSGLIYLGQKGNDLYFKEINVNRILGQQTVTNTEPQSAYDHEYTTYKRNVTINVNQITPYVYSRYNLNEELYYDIESVPTDLDTRPLEKCSVESIETQTWDVPFFKSEVTTKTIEPTRRKFTNLVFSCFGNEHFVKIPVDNQGNLIEYQMTPTGISVTRNSELIYESNSLNVSPTVNSNRNLFVTMFSPYENLEVQLSQSTQLKILNNIGCEAELGSVSFYQNDMPINPDGAVRKQGIFKNKVPVLNEFGNLPIVSMKGSNLEYANGYMDTDIGFVHGFSKKIIDKMKFIADDSSDFDSLILRFNLGIRHKQKPLGFYNLNNHRSVFVTGQSLPSDNFLNFQVPGATVGTVSSHQNLIGGSGYNPLYSVFEMEIDKVSKSLKNNVVSQKLLNNELVEIKESRLFSLSGWDNVVLFERKINEVVTNLLSSEYFINGIELVGKNTQGESGSIHHVLKNTGVLNSSQFDIYRITENDSHHIYNSIFHDYNYALLSNTNNTFSVVKNVSQASLKGNRKRNSFKLDEFVKSDVLMTNKVDYITSRDIMYKKSELTSLSEADFKAKTRLPKELEYSQLTWNNGNLINKLNGFIDYHYEWETESTEDSYFEYYRNENDSKYRWTINGVSIYDYSNTGITTLKLDVLNQKIVLSNKDRVIQEKACVINENNNVSFDIIIEKDKKLDLGYFAYSGLIKDKLNKNKTDLLSYGVSKVPNEVGSTINFMDGEIVLEGKSQNGLSWNYEINQGRHSRSSKQFEKSKGILLKIDYTKTEESLALIKALSVNIPLEEGLHSYEIRYYLVRNDGDVILSTNTSFGNMHTMGSVYVQYSIDGVHKGDYLASTSEEFLRNGGKLTENGVKYITKVALEPVNSTEVPVVKIKNAEYLMQKSIMPWHYHLNNQAYMHEMISENDTLNMIIAMDDRPNVKQRMKQILSSIKVLYESGDRYNTTIKIALHRLDTGMYVDKDAVDHTDKVFWLESYNDIVGALSKMEFKEDPIQYSTDLKFHAFNEEAITTLKDMDGGKAIRVFLFSDNFYVPTVPHSEGFVQLDPAVGLLADTITNSKINYAMTIIDNSANLKGRYYDYIGQLNAKIYPERYSTRLSRYSLQSDGDGYMTKTVYSRASSGTLPLEIENIILGDIHDVTYTNKRNPIFAPITLRNFIESKEVVNVSALLYGPNRYTRSNFAYEGVYYGDNKDFVAFEIDTPHVNFASSRSTLEGLNVKGGYLTHPVVGWPYAFAPNNYNIMQENSITFKYAMKNLVHNNESFSEYRRKDVKIHEVNENYIMVSILRSDFSEEEEVSIRKDLVELLQNARIGDRFSMRTSDNNTTTVMVNLGIIVSEKRRLELISFVKGYSFEKGTCEYEAYSKLKQSYDAELLANNSVFKNSVTSHHSNLLHYIAGPIQKDWTLNAFFNDGSTDYLNTHVTTIIKPINGEVDYELSDFESVEEGVNFFNKLRPELSKLSMLLKSNSNTHISEITLDTGNYSDDLDVNDKNLFIKFFGRVERDYGTQDYHMAFAAYGNLYCLFLDNRMMEYEITIRNPKHVDFTTVVPLVSAFRAPEENTNPLLIEQCPVMVIKDYGLRTIGEKYNMKHGMVYAKNSEIVIDEIYFGIYKSKYMTIQSTTNSKGQRIEERENKYDKALPSEDYSQEPYKPYKWPKEESKPYQPPKQKYPYPERTAPKDTTWKNNDPNNDSSFDRPQFPPGTTEDEQKDWLKDKLEEETGERPDDVDLGDWSVEDENGEPVDPVMTEDDASPYEWVEKEICSNVYDFEVPKPGSYKLTEGTMGEFVDEIIRQDFDIIETINLGLEYNVELYKPKDDYPFVEEDEVNPYSKDAERIISVNDGDIKVGKKKSGEIWVAQDADIPLYVSGGWIGQLYEGLFEEDYIISHKKGLVDVLTKEDLNVDLRNVFDHVYEGDSEGIVPEIEVTHDHNIITNDIPVGNVILRAESPDRYLTQSRFETMDDERHEFEIIPSEIFNLPDYDADYRLQVINESNNIYIDGVLVDKGDKLDISDLSMPIAISTGHHIVWYPWSGESYLKEYVLNGLNHLSKPEAGKKDVNDLLEHFDKPEEIRNHHVLAEVSANVPVHFKFNNNTPEEDWYRTETDGDNYTIGTEHTVQEEFTDKFVGPTFEKEFIAKEKVEQTVDIILRNPELTLTIDGRLENLNAVVSSTNPNVDVVNVPNPVLFGGQLNLDWPITIRPVSSEITKWHPIIHSGHYYFNNHEHYYFVETDIVRGKRVELMPITKEMALEIKIYMHDEKLISKTEVVEVIYDEIPRVVFKDDLINAFYPIIVSSGYTQGDVDYFEIIPSLENEIELFYEDSGHSKLLAKSSRKDNYLGETKYFEFDEENKCIVSPVPQQYAPVVVYDEEIGPFKRVNFLNEEGELTLDYIMVALGEGTQTIQLTHNDFDKDTLVVKIKGQTVDEYEIHNNIIVTTFLIEPKSEILVSYRIKNSFIVNSNIGNGEALIAVHSSESLNKTVVIYETNKDDSGRYAEDINLNTIFNPNSEGFVYLASEENYCSKLEVNMNPKTLNKGYDKTNFYIVATDKNGNPVEGNTIIVECKYGKLKVDSNITDINGVMKAAYYAPNHPCPNSSEVIKVTNIDANIVQEVFVTII